MLLAVTRPRQARATYRLRRWPRSVDIWLINGALSIAAAALYVFGASSLPQTWGAVHMPFVLLVAAFCITESWQSTSISATTRSRTR
jgi:hypothetical protein